MGYLQQEFLSIAALSPTNAPHELALLFANRKNS
jgi:hypothetical protein